jgi:IS30 family transposase
MITNEEEQRIIELRRSKVLELSSKGFNQTEISRTLNVSEPTVSRDIKSLRQQAKENIRNYIDNELPAEYNKVLVGLSLILKEAWITADKATTGRDKIQALQLAQAAYQMKIDLLTDVNVIEEAIRFIEDKKKEEESTPTPTPTQPASEPFDEDEDITKSEETTPIEPDEEIEERAVDK